MRVLLGSSVRRVQAFAGCANLVFELVEHRAIVLPEGVDETGEEHFGLGGVGLEEAVDEGAGALAFDFLRGERGGVAEGAVVLLAEEQALFEEAVEGGHDRGVGEADGEAAADFFDGAAAFGPDDFEDFALAVTEARGGVWRRAGISSFGRDEGRLGQRNLPGVEVVIERDADGVPKVANYGGKGEFWLGCGGIG